MTKFISARMGKGGGWRRKEHKSMIRFVSAVMGKAGRVEAERAQKTRVRTDPIVRTEK